MRSGLVVLSSPRYPESFHLITTLGHQPTVDANLHSPQRRLIELQMEHGDLDAVIDRVVLEMPVDELMLRRLKKRRLMLRDEIARLRDAMEPDEPA